MFYSLENPCWLRIVNFIWALEVHQIRWTPLRAVRNFLQTRGSVQVKMFSVDKEQQAIIILVSGIIKKYSRRDSSVLSSTFCFFSALLYQRCLKFYFPMLFVVAGPEISFIDGFFQVLGRESLRPDLTKKKQDSGNEVWNAKPGTTGSWRNIVITYQRIVVVVRIVQL